MAATRATEITGAGSDAAQKQSDAKEKLLQFRKLKTLVDNEHGMGYCKKPDGSAVIVIASPGENNLVTVPTRLSEEQFSALKNVVIAIPETQQLLYDVAVAYANRTPIMLEGGTAIGKTFAVNTFAQILYGPRAKIPDFYCNGQTDVSELMGKYVPAGLTPQELNKLNDYLKSEAGILLKDELKKDNGTVEMKELMERAAMDLGLLIQKGSFVFQLGVLPKAMTGTMSLEGLMLETHDGPGCMLHIQEVGMAAPSVINALLKIRGTKGKLATDIQVHEDGGRLIEAGEGFFLVFSTNPPGQAFKERFEIDSALSRALVWKVYPDELSVSSMAKVVSRIFDFSRVERRADAPGAILDLSAFTDLAATLGVVVQRFHRLFVDKLRTGEPGRKQKVPATIDSLWKVAELMQNHQIPDQQEPRVDFVATLTDAIQSIYIDSLRDKPSRIAPDSKEVAASQANSIGRALFDEFEAMLDDRTLGVLELNGESVSPREKITRLTPDLTDGASTSEHQSAEEEARAAGNMAALRSSLGDLAGLLGPNSEGFRAAKRLAGEI